MLVYSVTLNVDKEIHQEWIKFMTEEHIPEVMDTGMFVSYGFYKLITLQTDETGITYNVQYFVKDKNTLDIYKSKYARDLQKKHTKKFGEKVLAFRSEMERVIA